jgi:hypothetical protein
MPGIWACAESASGSGWKRLGAEAQPTSKAAVTAVTKRRLNRRSPILSTPIGKLWWISHGVRFGSTASFRRPFLQHLSSGQQRVARPVAAVVEGASRDPGSDRAPSQNAREAHSFMCATFNHR